MTERNLIERANTYLRRNGRILGNALGTGVQGSVFVAKLQGSLFDTAIKIHEHDINYRRERDVYLRLREYNVTSLRGCNVPLLIDHDDGLYILEMEIVQRPFVLDFGGAYLDYPPDFTEDVLAEEDKKRRELYGEHYPEVMAILRELEGYDIYMIDVHPGNISFGIS